MNVKDMLRQASDAAKQLITLSDQTIIGILKETVERTLKLVTITIWTARPGIVIGKGGQDVDKVRQRRSVQRRHFFFTSLIKFHISPLVKKGGRFLALPFSVPSFWWGLTSF